MRLLVSILFLLLVACSADKSVPVNGGGGKENFTERYNANLKFYSATLHREVSYSVLLPENYSADKNTQYGVVYLLHGWGGDQSSWGPSSMNIQSIIDLKTKSGQVRSLIYIMPQGFNSYYCNRYDGQFAYMDMFAKELVPHIDSRFRTTAKASERAVVGFSMGGFGALTLAIQHKELFGVCVGLSPSLNTDEQYKTLSSDGWNLQWGSIFGGYGTSGESRITSYYRSQCPLHLFADKAASDFDNTYFFIDCGDDEERLSVGNGALHLLMRNRNIRHEYRVRDGAHTESYWRESMLEALPFIEKSFSGERYPLQTNINYTVKNRTTEHVLSVGGVAVSVELPNDYSSASEYKVLYYEQGAGAAAITSADVAEALDSLVTVRRVIIAGFNSKAVKQASVPFADICQAVDNAYSTQSDADGRLALVYGADADYLYSQSCGANRAISYFYAVDADCGDLRADQSAAFYYIDVADDGSNYRPSQMLYEKCRELGIAHQYRVRNGEDASASVKSGIYSASFYIGQFLKVK